MPHAHAQPASRRAARVPLTPGLVRAGFAAHRYQVLFFSLLLTLVVNQRRGFAERYFTSKSYGRST